VGSLPANAGSVQVVIDPDQPMRTYAMNETTLFRSDDAGQTWQASSQGLPAEGLASLALDPRQPDHLFVSTNDGALYLSEDGASSWQLLRPANMDATATP
jgi:photosystem II stability/assembly factor-like uncharacterized protein